MNLSNCPQLIIYWVFAILGLAMSLFVTNKYHDDNNQSQNKGATTVIHIVAILIMSGLYYFLCSYGHTTVAWVILLLPIIIVVFALIALLSFVSLKKVSGNNEGRHRRHERHHYE